MKQYGLSEEEAVQLIRTKVSDAWKDTNQAFLKPTSVPTRVLIPVLNYSRVMDTLYKECDGLTNSHAIKDYVASVLLKSFPL